MLVLPRNPEAVDEFIESIYCDDLSLLQATFLELRGEARRFLKRQAKALPKHEMHQANHTLARWDAIWSTGRAQDFWDFRVGRERRAIPQSADLLPEPIRELTDRLADRWGLRTNHVLDARVPVVFVLGGLIPSSLDRVNSLRQLIESGRLLADDVVALAGNRVLSFEERTEAMDHGITATDEADALRPAVHRALPKQNCLTAVAPDFEGGRATTMSAFSWWLANNGHASSAAVVTTSVYRIQSHISLLSQTDGTVLVLTASVNRPGSTHQLRPQHYLQEIKASLDAVKRFGAWPPIR